VELLPGTEKSGIDFQMHPVPVTYVHGTLAAGSANWRGRNLQLQLLPLDPSDAASFATGGRFNPADGSFEFRRVFPGSYRLTVFSDNDLGTGSSQGSENERIGATVRVDVGEKPVEISVQLLRAMDVSGRIEIESDSRSTDQITPGQIGIELRSENALGSYPQAKAGNDGSFTIKGVLPGEWRIGLTAGTAFLKSAWLGTEDITRSPLDLTSGSAAPLRLVVSSNTATIRGTAPASQTVFVEHLEDKNPPQGWTIAQVDPAGQFSLQNLAPGRYRVAAGENGGPMREEGGQEVTLREGETATIDVKPESKP
jgi:hypothetical protein